MSIDDPREIERALIDILERGHQPTIGDPHAGHQPTVSPIREGQTPPNNGSAIKKIINSAPPQPTDQVKK